MGTSPRRANFCQSAWADDVVDLGALDGRAAVLDAAQDVLQLGQCELGLVLGEDLQILELARGERGDEDAVVDGVHGLGQLAEKGQRLRRQIGVAHGDGGGLVHVVQQLVDEDDVGSGLGEQLAQLDHARRASAPVAIGDDGVELGATRLPTQTVSQLAPERVDLLGLGLSLPVSLPPAGVEVGAG